MVKVETENLLPVFVMLSLYGLKAALIASFAIYIYIRYTSELQCLHGSICKLMWPIKHSTVIDSLPDFCSQVEPMEDGHSHDILPASESSCERE